MKVTVIIFISLIGLATLSGCTKDDVTICRTLSKQGSTGLSSIVGEWTFETFAHTKNGKKFQKGRLIEEKGYINVTDTGSIIFYHTNTIQYKFELYNSNDIRVKADVYHTKMYSTEEERITIAFENCLCYVVKENKLYIHYTEKDGMNVLILTKR